MGCERSMCWSSNTWGVLDTSVTDGTENQRKVVSGREVADAIRSLVNAKSLQFEIKGTA